MTGLELSNPQGKLQHPGFKSRKSCYDRLRRKIRGWSDKYLAPPPDGATIAREIYYRVVHCRRRLLSKFQPNQTRSFVLTACGSCRVRGFKTSTMTTHRLTPPPSPRPNWSNQATNYCPIHRILQIWPRATSFCFQT